MEIVTILLSALAALMVGGVIGFYGLGVLTNRQASKSRAQAAQTIHEAQEHKRTAIREAEDYKHASLREVEERGRAALLETKEESLRLRATVEAEMRDRRTEIKNQEQRLANREEHLERRSETLERRDESVSVKEKELESTQAKVEELRAQQLVQLEAVSKLTVSEAKDQLMVRAEQDMRHELTRRFRELEQQAKEEADQKARRIVTLAIHRLASDVVSQATVSTVQLPNDEMKGRLIGREGRNIRAIEQATGVDLIVDDTPEAVTVSCFDPVRREVAKLTLQRLIKDGRIQPARIEDAVTRAQEEVDQAIWEAGEKAVIESGVRGLNPELIRLLGRLKYRYSYGENVLQHSVEVAHFAGMLASEIGADIQTAKGGALLHDIGKALSHEVEGPHAEIGADMAHRYGISDGIRQAIMEHHDEEMGSVEAFLVSAADAMSASRPGARRDTPEFYVKRLEALEAVANSFEGIEKSFAIQAGREVRVMVKPEHVDDISATALSRDIAKKIHEDLVYPGQIKVVVIRETRSVEYAR